MNNEKFGELISELRKEKSLTQRELADRLHVTDKAVSKWERGKGYPEITLLQSLADVLGVTASELLSGERNTGGNLPLSKADAIVGEAIEYAGQDSRRKLSDLFFTLLSFTFLTGAFVSLLCNYLINGKLDWSLYPLGALIMTWLILAPWFLFRKHKAIFSLSALLVCVFPFLFLVEYLSPVKGWIPLAMPIVLLSIIPMYIITILWTYTKINRLYLGALASFLFGVVVNLGTNAIVQNFLSEKGRNISVPITAASFALLTIVLVFFGWKRRRASSNS
jgi:transcriptional regulator with XRE-family HTH domain